MAGLRAHAPAIRRVTGAVLVLAAVLFTTSIPDNLAAAAPGYTDVLQAVERSDSVSNRLRDLETTGWRTGGRRHARRAARSSRAPARRCRTTARRPSSPASRRGSHTDGGKPLTLAGLRGRVVLIDFWTYSCINCLRTLPQVTAWDAKYRAAGLTIVGVHSPEFAFEHVVSNIQRAIARPGHPLPGGGRQRPRDLVGLGQPVLAGGVPDRPGRPRPVRLVRRGRLRQDRDRDPRPAGRAAGADRPEPGDRAEQRGHHARDLPRVGARRSPTRRSCAVATPQVYTLPPVVQPEPGRARRHLDDRGRAHRRRPRRRAEAELPGAARLPGDGAAEGQAGDGACLAGRQADRLDQGRPPTISTPSPRRQAAVRVRELELHLPPGTSAYAFTFG